MEWFRMQTIWGASLKRLSDAEAGRFIKAVYDYVRDGKEYDGNGKEEILVVQALETLQTDIEAFDKYQKDAEDKKQAVSDARRSAVNKRWDKRNSIQADTNEYKSKAQNTNNTNSTYIKNKNNKKEYEYKKDKDDDCCNNTPAAQPEADVIIGIDGLPLDLSRTQNLDEAEKLVKRFKMPQAENVLQSLADDIEEKGLETVQNALIKASESDIRGGVSLNFYRAILTNKGQKNASEGGYGAWKANPVNQMIRHSEEERKESTRKAVIDLDAM